MSILQRWRLGKKEVLEGVESSGDAAESPVRHEALKLVELAIAAQDSGDPALALERVRTAIDLDPECARAHLNLGNLLEASGDLEGAIAATSYAIALDERYAEAHLNLGRLHALKGEGPTAESCYLRALKVRPGFAAAAMAMAACCVSSNRIAEAESWLRGALEEDPRHRDATFALCRLLWSGGRSEEMEQVLLRAVDADPDFAEAYANLGDLYRAQHRHAKAIDFYAKGIAAAKDDESPEIRLVVVKSTFVMATLLLRENRWHEGTEHLLRSMELMPESAAPHVNLAWMELRRARPKEAIAHLRKAIELDPDEWSPRSFVLFALNLLDDMDSRDVFLEHRRFGEWIEARTQRRVLSLAGRADPGKTLRVGYVSADFRLHPVMQFITPVLEDHDRTRVQPFCYSNTVDPDQVTQEFLRHFTGVWRDIRGLSDDDAAKLMVEDEIDILVDLSGHTGDSRLSIFALKPAPIQVSWLGYLNTTGLKTMDYRLVDRHTDPPGSADDLHTERLYRLPDSQWAYWPMFEVPIMRSVPSKASRNVLFGSFNQFTKLSDRALELWGRVLTGVPDARLRVAGLPPGDFEEHLMRRLEKVGVAGDRVSVAKRVPVMEYLKVYNDVDIALDTMPYNGATTTLDTLWMGVPIVGLVGARSISRGTYSILKTLGLEELLAETPGEYVDLNVRLATDADWRNRLHESLRERLRRSPLTDVSGFTENLEMAYRTMWREWCAAQQH